MTTNIVNKNGIYVASGANFYGSAFSFELTGTGWSTLEEINTSPVGPNKYYLSCTGADGNAIEEVLKGKSPNGLGKGQNNYQWINGINPSGSTPQIDYIIAEDIPYIFKVLHVLTNNLIEVESLGGAGEISISSVNAHYTKGVQLNSLYLSTAVENKVVMANNNTSQPPYKSPTTLHFTEGCGPVFVFGETGEVVASFKKSLERLL